jgi:RNA polymerase sigma-70 factor (ECF subfamily)
MVETKVIAMTSLTQRADISASEVKIRFEDIFLENWPKVYRFLARLIGDSAEAEDLALETFLRLYQSAESDGKYFNVGGWLYRVAYHKGLNAIRSRQRRREYELTSGVQDILEQNSDNPAETYAAKEAQQASRQVLARMNPRQSQILVLRHSGLSYQEIAEIMGVSTTSIGPLLTRAEREFEKRYRSVYPEGG